MIDTFKRLYGEAQTSKHLSPGTVEKAEKVWGKIQNVIPNISIPEIGIGKDNYILFIWRHGVTVHVSCEVRSSGKVKFEYFKALDWANAEVIDEHSSVDSDIPDVFIGFLSAFEITK